MAVGITATGDVAGAGYAVAGSGAVGDETIGEGWSVAVVAGAFTIGVPVQAANSPINKRPVNIEVERSVFIFFFPNCASVVGHACSVTGQRFDFPAFTLQT